METYKLKLLGLERDLPIIKLSKDLSIASFVLLGDQELTRVCAKELDKIIPEADILITAEAKGIPLVYELARLRNMKNYVVARKSIKSYMHNPVSVEVNSITTEKKQHLYLNDTDLELIKGKDVVLVDDVISTGESIQALEDLAEKSGASVVAKAAILAEGEAGDRNDIIFLGKLPLNPEK